MMGTSEAMERQMTQVGAMVKVIKGRYEGEKGRLVAIYPAHDGMTLVVKTKTGDVNIDIPVITGPAEYLARADAAPHVVIVNPQGKPYTSEQLGVTMQGGAVMESEMDRLRYVIEAKDEHGWFDYAMHSDLTEAKAQLDSLREGFGDSLRLIDRHNMLEVVDHAPACAEAVTCDR